MMRMPSGQLLDAQFLQTPGHAQRRGHHRGRARLIGVQVVPDFFRQLAR
jgi:hypothetical protein